MILEALLDTLVPPRCLGCGGRGTLPWCGRCAAAVASLRVRGGCGRCGGDGPGPHPCWREPSPVDATRVAFAYRGVVAASVVSAKVRGAAAAWPLLGECIAEVAEALHPDVVTWVPTDPARRRSRGLDHAGVLALPVADRVERPCVGLLEARPGRPDQATRAAARRREVPPGAFRATRPLGGARVLLVDDVVTTGATAWAAAGALRRAGAAGVALAVLARAGAHELGARSVDRRNGPRARGVGASVAGPPPEEVP